MEVVNNKIENIYPLTPLQYGMLFHNLYEADSSAYVIQLELKINKNMNPEIIKKALKLLSDKYSVLRTFFVYEKVKDACQVVLKERVLEFEYIDLSNKKNNEQDTLVKEIRSSDLSRGFDLQKDSLLRLKYIKLSDGQILLIFSNHHIIMDGWCNTILFKELFNFYERMINGENYNSIFEEINQNNKLTYDYGEYLKWLSKQEKKKASKYWKEELEGYDNDCEIKAMKKPEATEEQMREVFGRTSTVITEKLKAIAEKAESTINVAAETAVGIMLQAYTGSKDVVFGKVVSGRNADIPGIEDMVGLFINTIPLRIVTENGETVIDLLKKQQKKSIESTNFDYCSLAEIQNKTAQGSDLIKVLYVFENYASGTKQDNINESEITVERSREQTNYGISISGFEEEGKLGFKLMYDPNKYCDEEVQMILERLLKICEEIANKPDVKVSELETVTESEKQLILNDFNATETEYPRDKTVVELFEEQVKKTPDNIALVFEDKKLTYAELNARANSLAHKLRELGVKPDDFVAIIADKSIEIIEGIYGIIKAGGAYVPIDPTYPEDRIAFMLEDCQPKAVLKFTTESITIDNGIPVIDLADSKVWEGASENPEVVNKPEDAIYCIYTSGTTGKPKGVVVEHHNVVKLVKNCDYTELNEETVILQTGQLMFDASTFEVWGSALNGGTLHLISKENMLNAETFKKYLVENKVNTLFITTALFNQFIGEDKTIFNSLKHLMFGGEATSERHVEMLRTQNTGLDFRNVYGPTETTTFAAHYIIDQKVDKTPIGKPISNTQMYILNGNELCGIGVPGELCIAGDGVARGYLNRPELTAEKFVKNPFGEGSMYRSGDLVRWLPDGNIEFLGRIDEQVKIHGFRIELGEIETRIREIENIKDCVVIVKADNSGDKAIYAYYTGTQNVEIAEIRSKLAENMPEYMVPAYMMQLEELPVTKNGKIDKRALPEIEARATKEYIAPRNEIEEKICNIFTEILNVEQVGIKDSFFELGGHSLRATRLVNRIEAETGTRIALKDVFSHPTVEQLAVLAGAESQEYIPIPKAEEKEYYPMSSAQKRTYLIQQMQPESVTYNMPNNMKLTGEVNADALRAALQEMTDRHEILRTAFLMIDGEPVQKVLNHVEADFEYVTSEESDEKLISEFLKPFDLASGKLVRVKLVNKGEYHLMMFDMHHIVGDGMSMNTFTTELMSLYNGEKLEPLTHQFKDYSEWMRSRDLSGQAEYWKSQFDDEIPVLDMPTDFPRPQEQSYAGTMLFETVDEDLSKCIKELVKKTGATEYMIFLAAAMVTLSKYSRQEDIVIGSPISGRTHRDTERMLGMFVNTLAMRGKPEKNKTFIQFLEEIKNTCLKAYENQEYPFEELVEAVDVQREMSRNPLFDVMLVLQNNENVDIKLGESEAEGTGIESTIAKFDMTFNISENDNKFEVGFEYCTDLFKAETAERIVKHFEEVLKAVTENAEQKLEDIEMMTAEEKQLILNDFNVTETEYPRDKTVVELFEEQVKKTPDNIALVFEDKELTYAELNARANSLAYKLRELGVKPDDFVAIFADRSIEMIAGIYGIIKAGGAYVPIDPTYPEDRIAFMLEDCGANAAVVYTSENVDIPENIKVIDLSDSSVWNGCSDDPELVNKPTDLAYCIYTSGTTGTPKGTMLEHHGVVNLKYYFANRMGINGNDRVLQFANYIFDASVWEMTMALLNGATLVCVPAGLAQDTKAFNEYCAKNEVTVATLPPNYYVQEDVKLNLRLIITAGSESNKFILEKSKDSEYINAYGPTETTVCATYWKRPEGFEGSTAPIGEPIDNFQTYIMNDDNLCGIGVPGELCIAGDGLARGYLNRPELTAEKFVKNPFGEGRMYKTGDLARWMPDGNIEYLGRIDEQVKIRGFRIELGEIESKIREIDNIKDCAVIARADSTGEKAIYSYYTSDNEVSVSEIRDRLSESLPEYMVPAYMMQIESIPVTRNGKLDRRALPEIETKTTREYVAPRNEAEEAVCKAFSEILGVERVGVHDSFFELGGDSIKAIRIISKLRNAGYTAKVKDIMTGKIAEKIAISIKRNTSVRKYEQGEVSGRVESTPIIKSFGEWNLAKPEHFNQSMMYPVDEIENAVIKQAVEELVKHHDVLRAVYRENVLEILPIAESKLCDFYEFDYSNEVDKHKAVEDKCTEIQGSIDLANGPLVKIAVFELGDTKQMMFCIHHLAVDGVSWRILSEDFETAVSQIKAGKEVKLPEKTASFIEWSKKLKEYGERLDSKEKEYWKNANAKIAEGRIAGDHVETEAGYAVAEFSKETTENLLTKSSNAYGAKIDEVLLAGLARAVGRVTGQKSVAIKLEGHGREEIHESISIDRTVGWFTNVYAISLECSEDNDEAIINAKDTIRSVPNMGMGYGYIEHETEPDISFNYLGDLGEVYDEGYNSGASISKLNKLPGKITLNGQVAAGKLQFIIMSEYGQLYANNLKEEFRHSVEELAGYCTEEKHEEKTASDYEIGNELNVIIDSGMIFFENNIDECLFEYDCEKISSNYVKSILKNRIIKVYSPSKTQKHFFDVEFNLAAYKLSVYNTSIDNIIAALNEMVKTQEVFRTSYDQLNDKMNIYEYSDVEIPIVQKINPEKWISSLYITYKRKVTFEGNLLSRIFVEIINNKHVNVYFIFHHSVADATSCLILPELFRNIILGNKNDYLPKRVFSDVIDVKKKISNKKSNKKFYEEVTQLISKFNNAFEINNYKYAYVEIRKIYSNEEIERINENPLEWLINITLKMLPKEFVDYIDRRLPFLLIHHGRTSKDYNTIGMLLSLIIGIYTDRKSIDLLMDKISSYQNKDVDIPDQLEVLDEKIISKAKNIPFFNVQTNRSDFNVEEDSISITEVDKYSTAHELIINNNKVFLSIPVIYNNLDNLKKGLISIMKIKKNINYNLS